MARARNIKPGFFESEQVGQASLGARLLFIALWQLADREGRLIERPMQIKAYAFRYDAVAVEDIAAWLEELASAGLIQKYEAGGQKLIEIPNFGKHQRPHQREEPSVLPGYVNKKHNLGRAEGPCMAIQPDLGTAEHNLGTAGAPYMRHRPDLGTAEGPYMGVEPALNVECGMLNVECGRGNTALTLVPPPANRGTDPSERFQQAAKFACEQLPAGGDVNLTAAAMRLEFQKSASFDGNAAGFCLSFVARVRKWRAAYDANPDLRVKAAQWWTRDGTYAQEPPKARAPRHFGPVDLKAGEDEANV